MNLKPDDYVPSVRWRMGEYQALTGLKESAKDRVFPFIVIPELEFDFEENKPKKTIQEHVESFPKRFKKKWGLRPAWVDVHSKIQSQLMDDGRLPVTYIFDDLAKFKCNAVPVTSLDATPKINAAVAAILKRDGRGVGVRARIEHIMKPGFKTTLTALLAKIGMQPKDVDLVIDLGTPAYEPYVDFADALISAMTAIDNINKFRNYILMGSAYPQSVPLDKPGGQLLRHDWLFYKEFLHKLGNGSRVPNFSDYTIVNPEFTPMDMRRIKVSGKVVYTSNDTWYIRKGGAFRDDRAQMHDHCAAIIKSGKFRGAKFSNGDDYIEKCANKTEGPSTLTYWKYVAINHHIMHVLEDLSKYGAAAWPHGSPP